MLKTILCFGDSNTWGLNPDTATRFAAECRWTTLLAQQLGADYKVIAAGQPNRCLVHNPPFSGSLSGVRYLKPYLVEHNVDLIIIALGTNDLKKRYNLTPAQIAQGLASLVDSITAFYSGNKLPQLLLLSPPLVREVGHYTKIYDGAAKKSAQLATVFAQVAQTKGCLFFDLATVAHVSPVDGVHLDETQQQKISQAVKQRVDAH
ncbi:SGNH/GDSL hydrolase family protein [Pseudoalteromonas sp.]|jgi:lysophospholipase L1-like esterase|uniref:SGNH/GDSL hydrolase family protein n=1 Tax=Pseudoalteromonas sp. TaxID=53249 RepID=UPI00356828A3